MGVLTATWVARSNFDVKVFVSSYYILLCHVWLLSPRSLLSSSERWKGSCFKGSGGGEEAGGAEGGETNWDIII